MIVDLSYCKVLDDMFKEKKLVGLTGKNFESLGAASTLNNLFLLRELIKEYKPIHTLEVGMAFGASTLAILSTLKEEIEFDVVSKIHVAIDPYQRTVWDSTGIMSIQKSGMANHLDLIEDFSYNALPILLNNGVRFDFAYIDGSHLFEDAFNDFFYLNKMLNPLGLLLFDDSTDPNVKKVIRFIQRNFSAIYQPITTYHHYSKFEYFKAKAANFLGKNQLTVFRKIGNSDREWNSRYKNF